jgi:hypothetical protein
MSTFDELDRYLQIDYSMNAWSDFAVDRASELIHQLDDAEWARLGHTWKARSVGYQVRLANAVFRSDKPQVISLLLEMLASEEVEVALAAAENLEAKDDVWAPDASLRPLLERVSERVGEQMGPGERGLVDALLARIPH